MGRNITYQTNTYYMHTFLVLGAGRSAYSLIHYLLDRAEATQWQVIVADRALETLNSHFLDHPYLQKQAFNVLEEEQRAAMVGKADIVISMLPARFHPLVAKTCLALRKHLLTASYVSKEMEEMAAEAKDKGLIFLNEIGLDPGIDHLSAMQVIDKLKSKGAEITSFESYTGGLVAPEYDTNPWNYKFTWNPRNVVLAGQGVAKYIAKGQYKYVPYHRLFSHTRTFSIKGYGSFEGYPNRDSLQYRDIYGLSGIPTMLRGTFRKEGYCHSWNHFVKLGLTDDTYEMEGTEQMTYRDFLNSFLPYSPAQRVEEKLAQFLGIEEHHPEIEKIAWLGLFSDTKIGLPNATPAQILQQCLENKWTLAKEDKDMIVMLHQFGYKINGERRMRTASMVIMGEDSRNTGMAQGVGLPLAIAARLLAEGKIEGRGVLYPTTPDLYNPILEELQHLGIDFEEEDFPMELEEA